MDHHYYYLDNFHKVLGWVDAHHRDLLVEHELAFLDVFRALPLAAQALFVRMAMRKGELFRSARLRYEEVGDPLQAAAPLVSQGWLDDAPLLHAGDIGNLLTRSELAVHFNSIITSASWPKQRMMQVLLEQYPQPRRWAEWCPMASDSVLHFRLGALCDRLRVMFFGNARQDWSEFVLADLGIFRYETVPLAPGSRAFATRAEVDAYLQMHACVQRLEEGEPPESVLANVPDQPYANDWLESRRARVLFRIAMQFERAGRFLDALHLHLKNGHPEARVRAIRMLERLDRYPQACALATEALREPRCEAELQHVTRMAPRLARALRSRHHNVTHQADAVLSMVPRPAASSVVSRTVSLPEALRQSSVELALASWLSRPDAPVYYVENMLFNALFGLFFWDILFAPVPGAFFHPFHSGPADLLRPEFHARRAHLFDARLQELDRGDHAERMVRTWREKSGLQCWFVNWNLFQADPGRPEETPRLLQLALDCIPPQHLKAVFARLCRDVRNNGAGFPDLIQFFPDEGTYSLIEVKGPGDRLRDNQQRWLHYLAEHGLPVAVCHVRWAEK